MNKKEKSASCTNHLYASMLQSWIDLMGGVGSASKLLGVDPSTLNRQTNEEQEVTGPTRAFLKIVEKNVYLNKVLSAVREEFDVDDLVKMKGIKKTSLLELNHGLPELDMELAIIKAKKDELMEKHKKCTK